MSENTKSRIKIFVSHFNKQFPVFQSDIFQPLYNGEIDFELAEGALKDDSGDNISDKNAHYGELTGHYWLWKNLLPSLDTEYVGVCQYRRFLDFNLTNLSMPFQPVMIDDFP